MNRGDPEQARRSRLQALMAEKGLELLLVTRREDVRYLTGFTGSSGSLLMSVGRSCFITDFRYQLQASREVGGLSILIQKKDFVSALHEALDGRERTTLWIEESGVTAEELRKLSENGFKPKARPDIIKDLRRMKDRNEIRRIRAAVRRAEAAFRILKRHVRPGASERDLGLRLELLMREEGARKPAFDTIVASGRNGAMPHASVTNRRLKSGDLVTFDFGAEADGYFSDMTRTYCIGRPSAKQCEIHDLVLRAQKAAVRSVRPGIKCRSVDDAARDVIRTAGHAAHFGHGTGHGIGLMVHEPPSVSPLSRDLVQQDMVFTVEPGVYIPAWGGVRVEDMVLVTEKRADVLTALPREIDGLKRL